MPVSSSSQKEEPRFLPRAVDGATEVERLGAPSRPERPGAIRTQRVPCTRRTREQRARQPAINDPSFGEDPERPGLWSRPSFEALREGQLVTAKHFPGYWDTLSTPITPWRRLTATSPTLRAVELSVRNGNRIRRGCERVEFNSNRLRPLLDPLLRSYPTCFFEWIHVGSPPAARRGPVAKTRNSKCPAQEGIGSGSERS